LLGYYFYDAIFSSLPFLISFAVYAPAAAQFFFLSIFSDIITQAAFDADLAFLVDQ
jgi:hypothetical protein